MSPKRKPEQSGPLSGYSKVGRRYQPPLQSLANVDANDWARDDLPDLLWPMILVAVHGDGGAKRITSAQEILIKVLDESLLDDPAYAFDGRLTSIEAIPSEMREAVLAEFRKGRRFTDLIGPEIAGVLSLYPDSPGRWLLVDPWLGKEISSPEDAMDLLREAIVSVLMDRHTNALVKSATVGWRVLRRTLSIHSEKTMEALKDWPTVEETRAAGDAVILSMFLVVKQPPEDHLEIESVRIAWAHEFWNANWRLTPCLIPVEEDESDELSTEEEAVSGSSAPEDSASPTPPARSLGELRDELIEVLDDKYGDFLAKAFDQKVAVDLYNPARHEVVGGLVKRLHRLSCKLLQFPSLWSSDSAAGIMRVYAETLICLSWMSLQPDDTGFDRYKDYGLGRRVLMRKHMEQMVVEMPEDVRQAFESVLGSLEARTGGEWSEQFQDVSIESTFAGIALRTMAEQTDLLDLYRHVFQTSSGVMHGEWWAIEDYELTRCVEPLHRFHLVPSVDDNVDPTLDFGQHLVDRFLEVASLGVSNLTRQEDESS
jgi:hypothetical protein